MQIGYLTPTSTERDLLVVAGAGDYEGELLVFRDAVLARAEVNRNRDEITRDGIRELAGSIALMPVDAEHRERSVIGIFTAGRDVDSALLVDGIIYAKRFPEEAGGILDGSKKLSIEAEVSTATCSVCGGSFSRRSDYCDHLLDPLSSGAIRKLSGLKAVGGGTTVTPAGTKTEFNRDKIVFMASEAEGDGPLHVTISATLVDQEENMEELEQLRARVQELVEQLALERERATAAEQRVLDAEAHTAEVEANLLASERSHNLYIRLMRAGFSDTELLAIKASLATTDEAVIELLIASRTEASDGDPADPAEPAEDDEDEEDVPDVSASVSRDVVMGDNKADIGLATAWTPELFGVQ